MTNRSEPREDDRTDLPADEQTDTEPSENDDSDHLDDPDHLEDVEDGAGCTEIWEHLSERREAERRETKQDA